MANIREPTMDACPVCETKLTSDATGDINDPTFPGISFRYDRCGEFSIFGTALSVLTTEGNERRRRTITSHAIRRRQRSDGTRPTVFEPAIFEEDLRAIWKENRLPTPQEQCDLLILLTGTTQPSWSEAATFKALRVEAEIGAALGTRPGPE